MNYKNSNPRVVFSYVLKPADDFFFFADDFLDEL